MTIPALMGLKIPIPNQFKVKTPDPVLEIHDDKDNTNRGLFVRNRPERSLDHFPLFPIYDNY